MGYYKSHHSSNVFLPRFGNFRGGLTRYLPNVTKVNNDQSEIRWLLVLRAGV